MRALDPLLFLTGHRGAIERIAATRHAWIVGAILVLSAGIARNYDHLDLLRESEWFIGPFAASLVSIVFIFLCVLGPLKLAVVGTVGKQLGTFLTLAWMTAPCAWLYGIPVEAMTDIVTATKWNIAFLAIVSLWRVALMTRAVAVLTGVRVGRALPLILAPAALEMMVGSNFKSMSLIGIMGGVRLPPHTELLLSASEFAATASFWTFLVALVACWITRGTATTPLDRPAAPLPRSWPAFALASLALWGLAALPLHRKIAYRNHLERLVRSRDYPAAIAFASAQTRNDFPRNHYLPPDPHGWSFPVELLAALPDDAPEWLVKEWKSNAVESLKLNLPRAPKDWKEWERTCPDVVREIKVQAEGLRSNGTRDRDEELWLQEYERLTGPRGAKESNQRFHPEQVPPPSR